MVRPGRPGLPLWYKLVPTPDQGHYSKAPGRVGLEILLVFYDRAGWPGPVCHSDGIHLAVTDALLKTGPIIGEERDADSEDSISFDSEGEQINFISEYYISINKMAKLISIIHHSPLLQEHLTHHQETSSVEKLKVLRFVKTRWNSLFHATERFSDIYDQLLKVIIDENRSR